MQAKGIALGAMTPSKFPLHTGRFLRIDPLHLLPHNQHICLTNFHHFYSPEFLYWLNIDEKYIQTKINIYKSEVFSLGLMMLEIATCPNSKPKFHKPGLR